MERVRLENAKLAADYARRKVPGKELERRRQQGEKLLAFDLALLGRWEGLKLWKLNPSD